MKRNETLCRRQAAGLPGAAVSSQPTCRFSARVSAQVADSHLRCRGRDGLRRCPPDAVPGLSRCGGFSLELQVTWRVSDGLAGCPVADGSRPGPVIPLPRDSAACFNRAMPAVPALDPRRLDSYLI